MKQEHISLNRFALEACGMLLCFESIPFVVHAGQSLDATDQPRPSINEKKSTITDTGSQGMEKSAQRTESAMRG